MIQIARMTNMLNAAEPTMVDGPSGPAMYLCEWNGWGGRVWDGVTWGDSTSGLPVPTVPHGHIASYVVTLTVVGVVT